MKLDNYKCTGGMDFRECLSNIGYSMNVTKIPHIKCVYAILNTVNGKVYVGQTKDLYIRLRGHRSLSRNRSRCNKSELYDDMQKFGLDHFISFPLYIGEDVENQEIKYIETLKATDSGFGYNKESGGSKGYVVSSETRKKLSDGKIGKKMSDAARRKMSETKKGKKLSDEARKRFTEHSPKRANHQHAKPILCVETGLSFGCIRDACDAIGVKHAGHISSCAKGKRNTAYGYHWKYVD